MQLFSGSAVWSLRRHMHRHYYVNNNDWCSVLVWCAPAQNKPELFIHIYLQTNYMQFITKNCVFLFPFFFVSWISRNVFIRSFSSPIIYRFDSTISTIRFTYTQQSICSLCFLFRFFTIVETTIYANRTYISWCFIIVNDCSRTALALNATFIAGFRIAAALQPHFGQFSSSMVNGWGTHGR